MARILIVDDDSISAQLYVNKMTNDGHEVVLEIDGEDARAHTNELFDLILLDVMIPHVDGITLLQEFRSGPNANTTILIYTNLFDDNVKQKAMDAGATEFLHKVDYTPQQLITKLETYAGGNTTKPQTPPQA